MASMVRYMEKLLGMKAVEEMNMPAEKRSMMRVIRPTLGPKASQIPLKKKEKKR